jgi:hypothetical protein
MIKQMLFLNSLLFLGLLCSITPIHSIPVEIIPSSGIVYPIHVACECDYNLYVDGKKVNPAGIVRNWDGTGDGVNVTNIFNPVLFEPSPKIIAFNNIDTEYPGFMNGFVMDINNGKDYTKHTDWKCKYFDPKVSRVVPSNWMNYDYDDSEWEMAVSYGMNYQNNSYQIFDHERDGIHLNAEWLWTSVNSNPNIYCRKKRVDNEPFYVESKPVTTSAPSQTIHVGVDKTTLSPMHTAPPSILVEPHKPVVSPTATHVEPHKPVISPTATPVEPHKPVISPTTTPVEPHKPVVSPSATHVEPHKPVVSPSATPVELHKPVVSPSANHVEPHKPVVSPSATHVAAHKPVVSPSATHVAAHKPVVSPIPTTVEQQKPVVSPTSVVIPTLSKSNNIIINQHITNIIQKFKFNQKHSYSHMENLIRNLKYITQNHDLYKNLIYTRNHLYKHYNTIFKELYRLCKKFDCISDPFYTDNDGYRYYDDDDDNSYDDENEDGKIPPFIQSMKILEKYIHEIEKSIQLIKGKYRYTYINILLKLKLQYRKDTIRLIHYWRNGFGN